MRISNSSNEKIVSRRGNIGTAVAIARREMSCTGNPLGRPNGSKNITTVLKETLPQKIVITENGRKTVTKLEGMYSV